MSLAKRHLVPELMDDPTLDEAEHRRALAGLRRINFWSGTSRRLAKTILRSLPHARNLQILDVGSGGGDVAAGVFQKLIASGRTVALYGWDFSETATQTSNAAHRRQSGESTIEFITQNAFATLQDNAQTFDVVYCSLFLHHFSDAQAVQLIELMALRTRGVLIVDDLCRSTLGYWLAKFGCQVLSRSPVVHFDGPQSVRAAFTAEEAAAMSKAAHLDHASLTMHWPQRFQLLWHADRRMA